VRSKKGKRWIKASDFFKGIMDTAIEPNELLVEITVPKVPPGTGFAFVEISRRQGDYALAGIAAQMTLSGKTVTNLRLAACGVGPCPIRLNDAEKQIFDDGLTEKSIQLAARAAALEIDPETDLHATADYRRRLTAVLTQQALLKAKERAQENS
jgi:CO/xanthine dehydrogenase FAD-binding subunit